MRGICKNDPGVCVLARVKMVQDNKEGKCQKCKAKLEPIAPPKAEKPLSDEEWKKLLFLMKVYDSTLKNVSLQSLKQDEKVLTSFLRDTKVLGPPEHVKVPGDLRTFVEENYANCLKFEGVITNWGSTVADVMKTLVLRHPRPSKAIEAKAEGLSKKLRAMMKHGEILTGTAAGGQKDTIVIHASMLAAGNEPELYFCAGHETGHCVDFTLRPNCDLQRTFYPQFKLGDQHSAEFFADCFAANLLLALGKSDKFILDGANALFQDATASAEHPDGKVRINKVDGCVKEWRQSELQAIKEYHEELWAKGVHAIHY